MVDMAVAMEVMVVMDMERGLLMPKPLLKLMLSQATFPEDMEAMVGMAVAMEVMVVMDMERGLLMPKLLLKLMLSLDTFPEDMEAMVDMAVAMEDMVVMDMDMERGLLILVTMVDMAAVMDAMAEAMVMDIESNCYNC